MTQIWPLGGLHSATIAICNSLRTNYIAHISTHSTDNFVIELMEHIFFKPTSELTKIAESLRLSSLLENFVIILYSPTKLSRSEYCQCSERHGMSILLVLTKCVYYYNYSVNLKHYTWNTTIFKVLSSQYVNLQSIFAHSKVAVTDTRALFNP